MSRELEFTEQDIELNIQKGDQFLARNEYREAECSYVSARQAALALLKTSSLNRLDRLIQRTRDREKWYKQITQESIAAAREDDSIAQLTILERMGLLIGQLVAMDYRETVSIALAARRGIMGVLNPENILDLAQKAMERQDYALVIELLTGIEVTEETPTYRLLQRARRIMETEIEPRLQQADQPLTQGRPLEGLGPLQEIRRAHPQCPAWREPWFAAGRVQGEFLLERGRQSMSEAQYVAARVAFKEAYQAFERGSEAYPGTHSTQMLLMEAQDLREVAIDMAAAEELLQAQREAEALQRFNSIYARLNTLMAEGREYSLIKYEVELIGQRLSTTVGHVLDQVNQLHDARRRNMEAEAASSKIAALNGRLASAREIADWQAIIADCIQLEASLPNEDERKQCREIADKAWEAMALRQQAGRETRKIEQLPESVAQATGPEIPQLSVPSSDVLARMAEWAIQVDPILAQARVAFMNGDRHTASKYFSHLGRSLEQLPKKDMATPKVSSKPKKEKQK
jgi:hypothetical protein